MVNVRSARGKRGLQSGEGAPKISEFMKFLGETGTASKPSEERWASLFMGDFCELSRVKNPRSARITARLKSCPDTASPAEMETQ